MWPTCIGLATFGELKSMTSVFARVGWRHAEPAVGDHLAKSRGQRVGLQPEIDEPAPAISGGSHSRATSSCSMISCGELPRIRPLLLSRGSSPRWSGNRRSACPWRAEPQRRTTPVGRAEQFATRRQDVRSVERQKWSKQNQPSRDTCRIRGAAQGSSTRETSVLRNWQGSDVRICASNSNSALS